MYMISAPVIGIDRLRMGSDGQGITTLVGFHGCTLRCKYCINPQSIDKLYNKQRKTTRAVMEILKRDELYYLCTGGGVTFGGGEPMLRSLFIAELMELGAKRWHTTVETSLNVPRIHLERLLPYVDEYIVDIKDTSASVYKAYTGADNDLVLSNLKWLVEQGKKDSVVCRIPIIPDFNTAVDRLKSRELLSGMGIDRFDYLKYSVSGSDCVYGNGRRKCNLLKDIRKMVAHNNSIEYKTTECYVNGSCRGYCRKCEKEADLLLNSLLKKSDAGNAVDFNVDIEINPDMFVESENSTLLTGDIAGSDDKLMGYMDLPFLD